MVVLGHSTTSGPHAPVSSWIAPRWSILLVLGIMYKFSLVAAQCGPDQSMPYPPGTTVCPAGPPPGGQAGAKPGAKPGGGAIGGPMGGGGGDPGAGGGGYAAAQAKMGAQQACTKRPCAAALLGDVGRTTVAGRDDQAAKDLPVWENIYGPYEAGFGTQQDNILAQLGCNPGSKGHVEGGIDTHTADMMLGAQCEIEIPRWENGMYDSDVAC